MKTSVSKQNVNQIFWEGNYNTKSESKIMHGAPFPNKCLKNPGLADCNKYDSVDESAETHCDCTVTYNEKTYTDVFDMKITFEYNEPFGAGAFSDTNYKEELFRKYCDFVCQDFAEKIKNDSSVE